MYHIKVVYKLVLCVHFLKSHKWYQERSQSHVRTYILKNTELRYDNSELHFKPN